MIGTSKVKKQQYEIEKLKDENKEVRIVLTNEINALKNHIENQKKEHSTYINKLKLEYTNITNELKQELQRIYKFIPDLKEIMRMELYCRTIGFPKDAIIQLIKNKPLKFSGSLYSTEYNKKFKTENSIAKVIPDDLEKGKLKLTINDIDFKDWCKQKSTQQINKTINRLKIKL